MFRKPREAALGSSPSTESPPLPSIGRPPTPPSAASKGRTAYTMASQVTSTPMPLIGRNKTVARRTPLSASKSKGQNGSITNFFKKANSTAEDENLFLESPAPMDMVLEPAQTPTPPRESPEKLGLQAPASLGNERYNEDTTPVKRQKTGGNRVGSDEPDQRKTLSYRGPFLDDSDDDMVEPNGKREDEEQASVDATAVESTEATADQSKKHIVRIQEPEEEPQIPTLRHESTSLVKDDDFDDIEDFIDDEFAAEGEEYMERRYMEEMAEMENAIDDDEDPGGAHAQPEKVEDCTSMVPEDAASSACPICGGSTTGMSQQDVTIHVNDCLDGRAKPLPSQTPAPANQPPMISSPEKSTTATQPFKRLNKAAIARPGQANPFSLNSTGQAGSGGSAFSKLMSGHAEDTAWAEAAATEAASRGKPAYQRTCPFYKIMPGFFICVDAFRYGAVQGCNAYFLSHFHSDHYIGLTSSWCHGPIYCSRVTGNLVRRQLRVDPKWVVDLAFEEKVEVPNTQGVEVTMIPANHCPGSSLFLFEKTIGRGKAPKIQRVLHCGDFRACPAHVQHPKLRPEFLDHVTGKLAFQKIDVCYLDTTYLTPKYAFPSQERVITACAEMCVSLSKDIVDSNDSWETVKRERAGTGMVKFVRQASIKDEPTETDTQVKVEDEEAPPPPTKKSRGKLLVVVGTYSIGKERICLGVAKALNSKIYAPPNKQKIVAALEDPELSSRMTSNPLEAQVHMQMLMEIRAETLHDYLVEFKPHFHRIVGFRPSGWNYRPPNSRFTESPSVQTVLFSDNWKSNYSMHDLTPQRGSTSQSMCFGVPYSEHSSFRELTMFCCALRIDKVIPTVNVGSARSRERMKGWCEKWAMEKKKNGLYRIGDDVVAWS